MPVSTDNLKVGKKYVLLNHGEKRTFEVMERLELRNYYIKDLLTLEITEFRDHLMYGIGKDYDLYELT